MDRNLTKPTDSAAVDFEILVKAIRIKEKEPLGEELERAIVGIRAALTSAQASVDVEELKREVIAHFSPHLLDKRAKTNNGENIILTASGTVKGRLLLDMVDYLASRNLLSPGKLAALQGDETHACACKFQDGTCIDACCYHTDLEAHNEHLKLKNEELRLLLGRQHNERIVHLKALKKTHEALTRTLSVNKIDYAEGSELDEMLGINDKIFDGKTPAIDAAIEVLRGG